MRSVDKALKDAITNNMTFNLDRLGALVKASIVHDEKWHLDYRSTLA